MILNLTGTPAVKQLKQMGVRDQLTPQEQETVRSLLEFGNVLPSGAEIKGRAQKLCDIAKMGLAQMVGSSGIYGMEVLIDAAPWLHSPLVKELQAAELVPVVAFGVLEMDFVPAGGTVLTVPRYEYLGLIPVL